MMATGAVAFRDPGERVGGEAEGGGEEAEVVGKEAESGGGEAEGGGEEAPSDEGGGGRGGGGGGGGGGDETCTESDISIGGDGEDSRVESGTAMGVECKLPPGLPHLPQDLMANSLGLRRTARYASPSSSTFLRSSTGRHNQTPLAASSVTS